MVAIRDAHGDELDVAAAVMVDAYEQYIPADAAGPLAGYREEIRDVRRRLADATLIVAEDRGRIAGAVTYYPDARRDRAAPWPAGWACFRLLAVHPDARGRGIGRLLTEECIRRARDEGCAAVALHTTELMAVARAMYERMGFTRVPQFDFEPMPHLHVLAYRLLLSPSS